MKQALSMARAAQTCVKLIVGTVLAAAVSVAPHAAAAQTGGPAEAVPAPVGALGPEACQALQAAMTEASNLTAASMADLQEYKRRMVSLIAELEKDVAGAGPDERASRLGKIRNLHQQLSSLSVQEEEVLRQEGRLSTSRADLRRLCPPAGERRQGTPD